MGFQPLLHPESESQRTRHRAAIPLKTAGNRKNKRNPLWAVNAQARQKRRLPIFPVVFHVIGVRS
jgi:hypothetical protein